MNFKYDLVIRFRPDLYIIDKVEFSKFSLIDNNIYSNEKNISEFFFGSSKSMDKIINYYQKCDNKNLISFCMENNINNINHNINYRLVLSLCNNCNYWR